MVRRKWETKGISVEPLIGGALRDALPALAALRIAVFREFPYLYEGDLAYERAYLSAFSRAEGAIIVVAQASGQIIGASTGMPMIQAENDWKQPFLAKGRDINGLFYCAESVLRSTYRGLGIGHAFFDQRESWAQSLGLSSSCFCSVVRALDHPARHLDYQPLDAFWHRRGYAPLPGIEAEFSWKDVGETDETFKRLQFWERSLV